MLPGLQRIISGGQTGADRAALDFAIAHGIQHGGWCPKGRLAGDGTIDARYNFGGLARSGYSSGSKKRWKIVMPPNVIESNFVENIVVLDGYPIYDSSCSPFIFCRIHAHPCTGSKSNRRCEAALKPLLVGVGVVHFVEE